MFDVLRIPAYRRLLASYSLNELAWSIGSVSLSLLVYRQTGSALGAAAFYLAAQFLPALISPVLVARLDQYSMQSTLPLLYGLEGLAYGALTWVTSRFSLAPVLALTLLDGIVAMIARALARTATVAVTSSEGLLREGNALTNTAFSVCFMVGPAVGGALVAAGGVRVALVVNTGVFAAIVLVLATAKGLPGGAVDHTPSTGRLRAAIAYARAHPGIRTLLSLQAAALLFFTISIPVEVVLAQHSLHAGPDGYGGLLASWGAGALAGSAIFARWRELPPRTLISLGAASLGVGFVMMAAAPVLALALVGAALGGLGQGVEAVSMRTALQEQVGAQWMARIMSFNESIFDAVPGAGILLGGAITALAGPRIALAIGGGGAFVMAFVVLVALGGAPRRHRRRATAPAAQQRYGPESPEPAGR